jgi:hypothetical protein
MGSVTIFGNQRVQNSVMRQSCKLKEFSRHYVPRLNLFVDFHYKRGLESVKDRIVGSLNHLGRYLEAQGINLGQRKIRILLLPLRDINEKPSGKLGDKTMCDFIQRKGVSRGREKYELPISAAYVFPDTVFIAAHMFEGITGCGIHEVIHALSAKTQGADSSIVQVGVCVHNRINDVKEFEALNEGLTGFLARMFGEGTGSDGLYAPLVKGVSLLGQVIGVKPLLEALFGNNLTPIENALAAKGFPKSAMTMIELEADADLENYFLARRERLFEYIAGCIR